MLGKFSNQTNAVYAADCSTPAALECLFLIADRSYIAGSELFATMVYCTGFEVAVCLIADCLV
jgi:hypothetical protein